MENRPPAFLTALDTMGIGIRQRRGAVTNALLSAPNVRDNATEGQRYADLVDGIGEYGVLVALSAVRGASAPRQ